MKGTPKIYQELFLNNSIQESTIYYRKQIFGRFGLQQHIVGLILL